ncbi:MAG: tetratricopeptide repeat protein [Rhodospirillaceae bacterium]|jgi:tetratricopeptide (TPR) repeat protein|nr:tetratricopeptide repeat protein [Rhodospirillaceae bacterium]MBT4589194.1 tetratricopeptide repeat protein [Rhodospirillaceae bacterium]MBT5941757.1 tetratricopeptide repeat protein [Rhodospirillaceae bacterium]MBT7267667.1 tetratricopeptide repeat protein [Rhodospirillaceae bacterium]
MNSSDNIAAATELIQAGRFEEAATLLNGILGVEKDGAAQQLLGIAAFQTNQAESAVTHFENAARALTEDGYLQNNLGQAYKSVGNIQKAKMAFEKAAELQAEFADPLNYLGLLHRQAGDGAAAEKSFNAAIARRPGYAEAHFNLGAMLQDQLRLDEAQEQYQLALHAKPGYVQAINNLGTVLDDLGDHGAAEKVYLGGLEISPDTPELHASLGSCLRLQAKYTEACNCFERAIEIAPDFIEAKWNYGFLQLALGESLEGWANYRFRHSVDRDAFPLPVERLPEDLSGQEIELAAEQGLGDEIFFLRFAAKLIQRGASVRFQPNPKLETLIGRVQDVTLGPVGAAAFSIADLPYLLASQEAVPSLTLSPDEKVVADMQARLAAAGPPPYIGLTYRAGGAGQDTLVKNAPLEGIGKALKGVSATFIDVQRLPQANEQAQLTETVGQEVADFSAINDDLEQALALMSLLDDYVGVSNTNMHLRAATGKSARVLVTHPGEYRWLVEGARSPWFPDFELYRQDLKGSWEGAFAQLASDIKAKYE